MMTVAEYEMILTLSELAAKEYFALTEMERELYWKMRELEERIKAAYDKGKQEGLGSARMPPSPLVSDMLPFGTRETLSKEQLAVPASQRIMSDWLAGKFEKEGAIPG